jgi:hypothetical protein
LKTIGRSRNHAASALSRSVLEFRPPQNKCLRSGRQTELLEVQPRVECGAPADREEWSNSLTLNGNQAESKPSPLLCPSSQLRKPSQRNPAQSQIVNAAIQARRSNAQDDTENATKSVNRRVTGWDQICVAVSILRAHRRGSTGRLAQSSPSPTIAAASCPALRPPRRNAQEFSRSRPRP